MEVVGAHGKAIVDMLDKGIGAIAHAGIEGAGNDMPEMAVHVAGYEHLAHVIPIEAPRVGRSARHDFELT